MRHGSDFRKYTNVGFDFELPELIFLSEDTRNKWKQSVIKFDTDTSVWVATISCGELMIKIVPT